MPVMAQEDLVVLVATRGMCRGGRDTALRLASFADGMRAVVLTWCATRDSSLSGKGSRRVFTGELHYGASSK